MRPARFETFALELAKASPDAGSVMTLKEAGDTKHPSGMAVKLSGSEARYQFVAQSADGDQYDQPEKVIEGEPVSPEAVPSGGTGPERWLAGLVAGSRSTEIEALEVWSTREGVRPDHRGVTVFFHSGARIFARVL